MATVKFKPVYPEHERKAHVVRLTVTELAQLREISDLLEISGCDALGECIWACYRHWVNPIGQRLITEPFPRPNLAFE